MSLTKFLLRRAFALVAFFVLFACGGPGKESLAMRSLEDIADKRICVLVGSIHDTYVQEHFPQAKLVYVDYTPDMGPALEAGKCDVFIHNEEVVDYFLQNYPSMRILCKDIRFEELGFGFNKSNTALLESFNEFLAELRASGELKEICRKWRTNFDGTPPPEVTGDGSGGVLRFGTSGVDIPCSSVRDGKPAGYDVEIIYRFASKHNMRVDLQRIPFGGLIAALASGKVDVVANGMVITEERARQINFSDPYTEKGIDVVALERNIATDAGAEPDSPAGVTLAGKRIGVKMGSIYGDIAQERFPQAQRVYIDNTPDLVVALQTGKIDAFLFNEDNVAYFMGLNPDLGILLQDVDYENIAFGFSKSNPDLLRSFNEYIAELDKIGELEAISHKWQTNFEGTPPPRFTGDGSGGTLHFGTSGIDVPYSSSKDGQPAGIAVELLAGFTSKHNMKLELQRIPFVSQIAALSAGKVDVIGDGIAITEERARQIDFSDPFLKKGIDLVALAKDIPALGGATPAPSDGKFRTVDDIADKRVGVWMGSVYDKYAQEHFPHAQVVLIDATPDLILSLINDKCDAFMIHSEMAAYFMSQYQQVGLLAEFPDTDTLGFGFNYNNPDLHAKFNAFLAEMGQDELNAICDKWANRFADTPPPVVGGDGSGGVLRFGTTGTDVPCSATKDGQVAGYDIEIVYRFATKHNMRVEISRMPFSALIAALSAGKVDIIGNGIMVTPERLKQVNFSTPYRIRNFCFLALKQNIAAYDQPVGGGEKFTSVDDVADKRIGVLMGSSHDHFATRNFPHAQILRGDATDLVAALHARKIDALLFPDASSDLYMEKYSDIGMLQRNIMEDSVGFGFNPNNPALRTTFNAFLARIKASGELEEIVRKWSRDFDALPPPEVTGDGSGGRLRIGTTGVNIPYTMVKDGKPAGSDVEILYRFASEENMQVELQSMNFNSLIPALQSEKVDIIGCVIGMTEERRKVVDFSDCYMTIPVDVIALKSNIATPADATASADSRPAKAGFWASTVEGARNNLIAEKRYMIILDGLWTTILITFFSVFFGTLLGGVICWMRMSGSRFWRAFGNTYVTILAGTPVLVFLMIMFYVVFAKVAISPTLVAIIALALAFGSYISGTYKTSIETIDSGQREAGIAMGFTRVGAFRHIIFPQALRVALPLYMGEAISMLKTTAIVGYIAVEDLTKAGDIIRSRTFDAFFPLIMVALIYFVLAWLLRLLLQRLARNTDPRYRQQKALRRLAANSPQTSQP